MQLAQENKDSVTVDKIWLKNYPAGVPAEINPDAYQSISEIFEKSCKIYGQNNAFYNMGVTLTFSQIDKLCRDFAAYLQNDLKLKKGDRIAIMLPNLLQYPIAVFGALRIGLIVVNVNPLYTASELTFQINNSGANTLVTLSNFANTVQQALPNMRELKNIIISDLGDCFPPVKAWITNFVLKYVYRKIPNWQLPNVIYFKQALQKGKSSPLKPVEMHNDDIAFLQYTGGTTGISKGAILTHRNIIANMQQADAWFKSLIHLGKEVIITALPMYHIFSLLANCIYFSSLGGLNVLITNPRDIPSMIKDMSKFKFTVITGVNTLFNALLKNPNFAKLDFSSLRLALGGGMAVQEVVAEKWKQVTGVPILEAYGLTETSPCVSINPPDLREYNGTIGLPVSSTDVCILDSNGNELPIGEAGELAVKGPQVMKGYWENPTETQRAFTKDGWLLTGDIASIDQKGYLRILERKKDMILVSGFNVYPNEVEDVMAKMPGIREIAIVGVPDENSGESVKAYVVRDNPNLTEEEVIKYARQHLTPYKVPKSVDFCTELPKTNVGKILRRALRDLAMKNQAK